MRDNPHLVPKIRVHAELFMIDGKHLKGEMFIEVTSRIQDVLNGESDFFPFVEESDGLMIVNKNSVERVVPLDHDHRR